MNMNSSLRNEDLEKMMRLTMHIELSIFMESTSPFSPGTPEKYRVDSVLYTVLPLAGVFLSRVS